MFQKNFFQFQPGSVDPAFYGAHGRIRDFGDLLIAHVLHLGQKQRGPHILGQLVKAPAQGRHPLLCFQRPVRGLPLVLRGKAALRQRLQRLRLLPLAHND